MHNTFNPSTTIALITYNSASYISGCLASLQAAAPQVPVLVIDNGSTDATCNIIMAEFPDCHVLVLGQNIGHSAACNLAFEQATTTWVLLLDHDTTVPPGWLEPLLASAAAFWPHTGMVSSRAIFAAQDRIHHDGGFAHYIGHMTLHHGFIRPADLKDTAPFEVGAQAATSLLVHRERALAVGGFDPRFFIYLNDFELTLRMRLRGWRSYVDPASVVLHLQGNPETSWRGSGSYPARRAFLIYRNRWMLLLKIYSLRTLVVCAPMIMLYEFILLGAALAKGWFGVYCNALREVFDQRDTLFAQRKHIQATRQISDGELFSAVGLSFVPGLVTNPIARFGQRLLERVFASYWRLVTPFLD
jgi:GT2 family glycosyltransferase